MRVFGPLFAAQFRRFAPFRNTRHRFARIINRRAGSTDLRDVFHYRQSAPQRVTVIPNAGG